MCVFSLIGGLFSCLGSACMGCCCAAFRDCKAKYGPASRIPYMFLMSLCCAFAVAMTAFGEKALWENDLLNVELKTCNSNSCRGKGSVYRTSFTLSIFFIIHVIIVQCVLSFHHLFFLIKFVCIICVLTASFWFPNELFDDYAIICMYGSFVFLLIQIYVLIGWGYDVNERLINLLIKYDIDEDEYVDEQSGENNSNRAKRGMTCCIKFLLIFTTVIIYGGVITLWYFLFKWFVQEEKSCDFSTAMIIICIILCVIITILPIVLQTSSIFTSAIVCFYVTYLVFSGLESVNDNNCNQFINDTTPPSMWIGIGITLLAISYTGFAASKQIHEKDDLEKELNQQIEMEEIEKKKHKKNDSEPELNIGSNYNDVDDENGDEKPKKNYLLMQKKNEPM